MNKPPQSFSEIQAVSDLIMFNSKLNRMECQHYMERNINRNYKIRRIRPGMQSYFLSGSKAEFHIKPCACVNSHCGDLDFMLCGTDAICVNEGDHPTLPSDARGFDESVRCFTKIAHRNGFPGYCFLKSAGMLSFDWNCEKYGFIPCGCKFCNTACFPSWSTEDPAELQFVTNPESLRLEMDKFKGIFQSAHLLRKTGPAEHTEYTSNGDTNHTIEYVVERICCTWCPKWPTEAANWPVRPRKQGWPTTTMIQNIVRNGCHLVPVSHLDFPENLKGYQYRLSFSHAEITLLRSWTHIQQIAYHMIRYFVKRNLIKKDCPKEDEVLSGYHLKTLMLWMCEEKSDEWWNSTSIVFLLCDILRQLARWLKNRYVPSYFMPQVNILQADLKKEHLDVTLQKIEKHFEVVSLTKWLYDNYAASNSQESLPALMHDMARVQTQILDSTLRRNNKCFEITIFNYITDCLDEALLLTGKGLFEKLQKYSHKEILQKRIIAVSPDVILKVIHSGSSSKFLLLTSTILILYIEYLLTCEGLTCDNELVVDLIRGIPMEIKNLVLKSHNFPETYRSNLEQSHVLLLRSQEVMETITSPIRDSEFRVLSQAALAILRRCLESCDTCSELVRGAALVYMAAIYYAEQGYQRTIDLCSMALCKSGQPKSLNESSFGERKTLSGFCLLFVDDVARIIGFVLLFKHFQDPLFYSSEQIHQLLRITPEVFAEYLIAATVGCSPEYSKLAAQLAISHFTILDVLFMIFTWQRHLASSIGSNETRLNVRRCVYLRSHSIDKAKLKYTEKYEMLATNLLFEWFLDTTRKFSTDILDKYGIDYDTADCYRALYFFKCGRYMEVSKLCQSILMQRDCADPEFKILNNVVVLPPFDGIFDNDIQFLIGLQTLCFSCEPLKAPWKEHFLHDKQHVRHCCATRIQLGCSLASLKCGNQHGLHCLRKTFIARYVLLKTAIALGEPRNRIYSAFRRIESRSPFEVVVHQFLFEKFIKTMRRI